ncbi:hypothetical protein TNCV_1141881 [Trichonephila clavipes]|nr:hypothetical protein TNCV_1141881 [Trichonephila clavipes]
MAMPKTKLPHLSEANPQVYVETPLHPEKLTVWCALWAGYSNDLSDDTIAAIRNATEVSRMNSNLGTMVLSRSALTGSNVENPCCLGG